MTDASIIVLNYNGKEYLEDCLSSLTSLNYEGKYEIILVDNNSSDGSISFVRENYPSVRILELEENLGYTGGNNKGAEAARGKYIVFLNNDTVVDEDWLSGLLKYFKLEDVKCVTSKVIYKDLGKINSVGTFFSRLGISGSLGEGVDPERFENPFKVFGPSGCSFAIERRIFNRLGGFDDDYFIYDEDLDLGWRLGNLGYKTVYSPDSVVYHKERPSKHSKDYYRRMTRNRFSTITKNLPLHQLFRFIPLKLSFNLLQIFTFLTKRNKEGVEGIISGLLQALSPKNLSKNFRKRRETINLKDKMLNPGVTLKILKGKLQKHTQ